MPPTLSPQAFVERWERVTVNEKGAAQSHFNDLCHMLGIAAPLEADPTGLWYRFEKPLKKEGGGAGFADVWRQDTFAPEYKTKGKYRTLDETQAQLRVYKGDLGNPPALLVCDIVRYELTIEFTGYKTRVEQFTNADLLNASTRDLLRSALTDPQRLRPTEKTFTITAKIAVQFAQVAQLVEQRGHDPHDVAHFFMKLLFTMVCSMPISQGTEAGYNVQVAVDDQHKRVVPHDVTNNVTDRAQLSTMASRAKATLEVETLEVVTDASDTSERCAMLVSRA